MTLAQTITPILLAGPTAVGKSEIALRLAEKIGGEIISVDSMQVYRRLDLGTAKPSAADRARVPHHLIDVVELTEPFDAARFVHLARQAVADIQTHGRVPLLCGGTGLYFKAFLEGLGEAPPSDAQLRAELEAAPLPELLRELAERDPVTYEKIDRQNPRRVIRAVEVIRLTGKPFSQQRARWGEGLADGHHSGTPRSADIPVRGFTGLSSPVSRESSAGSPLRGLATGKSPEPADRNVCPTSRFIGLTRSAVELHQRIEARVDDMFRRGLVAETERLLAHGLADNKTALQALGYRQVVEHLRGERSLPETIELVKSKTRQFAKRQMTWFRKHARLNWRTVSAGESANDVASRIASDLEFKTTHSR